MSQVNFVFPPEVAETMTPGEWYLLSAYVQLTADGVVKVTGTKLETWPQTKPEEQPT